MAELAVTFPRVTHNEFRASPLVPPLMNEKPGKIFLETRQSSVSGHPYRLFLVEDTNRKHEEIKNFQIQQSITNILDIYHFMMVDSEIKEGIFPNNKC